MNTTGDVLDFPHLPRGLRNSTAIRPCRYYAFAHLAHSRSGQTVGSPLIRCPTRLELGTLLGRLSRCEGRTSPGHQRRL